MTAILLAYDLQVKDPLDDYLLLLETMLHQRYEFYGCVGWCTNAQHHTELIYLFYPF